MGGQATGRGVQCLPVFRGGGPTLVGGQFSREGAAVIFGDAGLPAGRVLTPSTQQKLNTLFCPLGWRPPRGGRTADYEIIELSVCKSPPSPFGWGRQLPPYQIIKLSNLIIMKIDQT